MFRGTATSSVLALDKGAFVQKIIELELDNFSPPNQTCNVFERVCGRVAAHCGSLEDDRDCVKRFQLQLVHFFSQGSVHRWCYVEL